MVCSGCGKESLDEFSFCPSCGKAFVPGPARSESPSPPQEVNRVTTVAPKEPTPPAGAATDRSSKVGTYVFGAFSVIALLVSIIKGIVPIYLVESAVWAGAAWYWHRKKTHSELAKAIVIVFAALVAIGEVIQIASEFRSESKQTVTSAANPLDSAFAGQSPSTEPNGTDTTSGASDALRVAAIEKQAIALFNQKRYSEAKPLFEQACNGTDENGLKYAGFDGRMRACNYLGYLYAQGLGGSRDTRKAHDVYQKACNEGTLTSCASLGTLYQNAGDDDNARRYFQRACSGGVTEACDLLRGVQ